MGEAITASGPDGLRELIIEDYAAQPVSREATAPTGWPIPPPPSTHVQAAALRAAFPGYTINVIMRRNEKPRFEAVSRDGGSPYALTAQGASECALGAALVSGACGTV